NMRLEDKPYNYFAAGFVPDFTNIWIKGGNGALQPLENGGFLGIIVGIKSPKSTKEQGMRGGEPTKIGLVEFDSKGKLVGGIRWVAEHPTKFLSFPQLVPLGDQSFLIGYGVMRDIDGVTDFEDTSEDEFYRIASEYYVQEVDKYGKK